MVSLYNDSEKTYNTKGGEKLNLLNVFSRNHVSHEIYILNLVKVIVSVVFSFSLPVASGEIIFANDEGMRDDVNSGVCLRFWFVVVL